MKLQARYHSDALTVDELVTALEMIRGKDDASLRIDLDHGYVRRVTITARPDGSFLISATSLEKGVWTICPRLASMLALKMIESLKSDHCWGSGYHHGVLNDHKVCRKCWVKKGNDISTWIPAGVSKEMWEQLGGRGRR